MDSSALQFHRRLSIAPMLDFTDRHERYFLRLLSKHVLLYTEMIVANALLHAAEKFIQRNAEENPVAVQLGGSDPKMLAECAKIVEDAGFDEVNLNCGCPSERVQCGSFGAILMKNKNLVAECVQAMQSQVKIPVTVKTRLGVDDLTSFEFFEDFIDTVHAAGCNTFIIHARTARLRGYSPKENREKPAIQYESVYRLKEERPELNISINGDIKNLEQAKEHLKRVDGVMMGRAVYANPWMLHSADAEIFGKENSAPETREELLELFTPYVEKELAAGCPLSILVKHLFGLFAGLPGGRKYRQILSEGAAQGAGAEILKKAISAVQSAQE
ncbi:MAG: tRNA dihydrouridine(20/20a) synthase DusA [Hallerella porci]|uniref:tRNA-dihydrouridine(20/20a) synthase n=1 Tax=Hallerella porci TaxID=1945871 RepID=A0ABX5LLJ1_9BACT|nr:MULTISPECIES: tRNA dihydrouridine(20/20a) synthase DusA [Hallerella]MCI5600334.1 tRNA dihydrouridine(20/20a) synthase DusA [Hallerella sp.]MDY3920971.1 tRNA dihydrouridine(20/20a) synthase DusA [Hallerella porci]PWL03310.1 tRNA-U16,U17-dihydrouridine synthase [Hallerella porci]